VQGKYLPASSRGISEARSVSKGEPDEAVSAGGVGVCSLFPFTSQPRISPLKAAEKSHASEH
jgi:hypothetical protein